MKQRFKLSTSLYGTPFDVVHVDSNNIEGFARTYPHWEDSQLKVRKSGYYKGVYIVSKPSARNSSISNLYYMVAETSPIFNLGLAARQLLLIPGLPHSTKQDISDILNHVKQRIY